MITNREKQGYDAKVSAGQSLTAVSILRPHARVATCGKEEVFQKGICEFSLCAPCYSRQMKRGFTLVELLVVIAIIGILSSVVLVSLAQARARSRYALVVSQMKEIHKAAELNYDVQGSYAADVARDTNPGFSALSGWPTPPCSGWTYDWESSPAWGTTRITLRKTGSTAASGVYYYCIVPNTATGVCDDVQDAATTIQNVASKVITCTE